MTNVGHDGRSHGGWGHGKKRQMWKVGKIATESWVKGRSLKWDNELK
jgi:hypothetical protein